METSELLIRLRELTIVKNPPPDGWFTVDQWAEKWGVSRRAASEYVTAGMKNGLMEKRMYRPESARQVLAHFRPRESGDSAASTGPSKTSVK